MKDTIIKSKNVDFFQVPDKLWQLIQHHFPEAPEPGQRGRPPGLASAAASFMSAFKPGVKTASSTGCWSRWCSSTPKGLELDGNGSRSTAERVRPRWAAPKPARIRPTEAKSAAKSAFWSMKTALRLRFSSPEPTSMTSGRRMIC